MKSITIPALYCPFESKINNHLASTEQHTNNWIRQFKLHEGADFEKFLGDNFAYMTARFYPEASEKNLWLANDINCLLFVMDDAMDNQVDRADMIKTRNSLLEFIDKCNAILHHPETYTGPDTGVFTALHDVWIRLMAISTPEWQQHFIESLQMMFQAAVWEFDNVAAGKIPTVPEFYNTRQFLGAAHISTDMISVIEEVNISRELLNHPTVHELTVLARNAVCWANDLFSLTKELEHGDKHNMVIIVKEERQTDLQSAIRETVMIHDKDIQRFVTLANELPGVDPDNADLRKYIRILSAILIGNIDWSSAETKRYNFEFVRA
ncbi:terpene synthase family protein [Chitinophaga sp.]|uniref:terpene synthase family protein n=1 Tax=Chitinophaga sp. TaxID=1869181 RepID=UPI002C436B63|nr:hypothetical protein [Chitinophaga sp.]HWV68082.1 hypothetical protein [Chitinophaga sp.]